MNTEEIISYAQERRKFYTNGLIDNYSSFDVYEDDSGEIIKSETALLDKYNLNEGKLEIVKRTKLGDGDVFLFENEMKDKKK